MTKFDAVKSNETDKLEKLRLALNNGRKLSLFIIGWEDKTTNGNKIITLNTIKLKIHF